MKQYSINFTPIKQDEVCLKKIHISGFSQKDLLCTIPYEVHTGTVHIAPVCTYSVKKLATERVLGIDSFSAAKLCLK